MSTVQPREGVSDLLAIEGITDRERAHRAGIPEKIFRKIAARIRREGIGPDLSEIIKVDPEFSSLIPPLTSEERQQLEDNLVAHGCIDPIVLWDGVVLDGHNRFEICQRRGIDFGTIDINLPDRDAAKAWIIRHQFGRRNINDFQRSELALKLKPLLAAEAEKRAKAGKAIDPPQNFGEGSKGETREHLARVAGVSDETIRKVEKIVKDASEKVKEDLRSGKRSIHSAYKEVTGKACKPKPESRLMQEVDSPTVTIRVDPIAFARFIEMNFTSEMMAELRNELGWN